MRGAAAAILIVLALSGCAAQGSSPEPEPTQTATVACPQVDHQEQPVTCAPFDPEAAAAQNERYRERFPLDEAVYASVSSHVPAIRTALEPVAAGGPTAELVAAALESAGFGAGDVQVDGGGTSVAFGVWVGEGCVFGGVWPDRLEVEAGGPIRDGGCLALEGH